MADTTRLEKLNVRLEEYEAAEDAILTGAQSYAVGSRQLSRASLSQISKMIAYLEKEIAAEKSRTSGCGRNCVKRIVPMDS